MWETHEKEARGSPGKASRVRGEAREHWVVCLSIEQLFVLNTKLKAKVQKCKEHEMSKEPFATSL